ncbi:MAG: hypothetical protein KAU14_04520, partial [Thermoplasmata archaeon]|nr:hypothetical protein [Thermoplasmata archaeon]
NDGDGLIDEDKDGGFTEPETQAMDELMKKLDIYDENDTTEYPEGYRPENHDLRSNVVTGISYHSYSALVIWPWGYTYDDPPHEPLLRTIGERMMDITDYASWKDEGGYKVSGEWGDWMYGAHGVLAYTLELNTGAQGGFHPQPELIIPTVRMNLGCNLYITEVANKAKVAKESMGEDLDLNFPEFVYRQKDKKVEDDESYDIELRVENYSNLESGSLRVWYRVGNGEWKYRHLSDKGDGVFKGKIPKQDGNSRVYFYFEGKDVRGIYVYSGYGEGTPYSYRVEKGGLLSIRWTDGMVVLAVLAFLYQGKRKDGVKKRRNGGID